MHFIHIFYEDLIFFVYLFIVLSIVYVLQQNVTECKMLNILSTEPRTKSAHIRCSSIICGMNNSFLSCVYPPHYSMHLFSQRCYQTNSHSRLMNYLCDTTSTVLTFEPENLFWGLSHAFQIFSCFLGLYILHVRQADFSMYSHTLSFKPQPAYVHSPSVISFHSRLQFMCSGICQHISGLLYFLGMVG